MVYGRLVGLTPDQLNAIVAAAQQCIVANAVRGISYSIAGRNFSFPSMDEASQLLNEANYALGLISGQRSAYVRCNFNPALGRNGVGGLGLSVGPPNYGDGNPF